MCILRPQKEVNHATQQKVSRYVFLPWFPHESLEIHQGLCYDIQFTW